MDLVEQKFGKYTFLVRPDKGDAGVLNDLLKKNEYGFISDCRPEIGDFWIDAGANIGGFAIPAAMLGADVVCFEPDKENCAVLQRNIEFQELEGSVFVVQKAIIEKNEDRFFIPHTDSARTAQGIVRNTMPTSEWVKRWKKDVDSVPGVSLSEHIAWPGMCLKMDIEGSEHAILDAKNVAWSSLKKLVMEYHFKYDDSIDNWIRRRTMLWDSFRHTHVVLPKGMTRVDQAAEKGRSLRVFCWQL